VSAFYSEKEVMLIGQRVPVSHKLSKCCYFCCFRADCF